MGVGIEDPGSDPGVGDPGDVGYRPPADPSSAIAMVTTNPTFTFTQDRIAAAGGPWSKFIIRVTPVNDNGSGAPAEIEYTLGSGGGDVDPPADLTGLFAGGRKGLIYDPAATGAVFQDTAGTTASTANDPVGKLLDQSPNGYHALQATSGSKPTLRTSGGLSYVEFDGSSDFLATAFTTIAQPMTVVAAAYFEGVNPYERLFDSNNYSARCLMGKQATNGIILYAGTGIDVADPVSAYPVGPAVWSAVINGSSSSIARNGTVTDSAGNPGTVGLVDGITIGAQAGGTGEYLTGRLYFLFVIDRLLTGPELAEVEAAAAARCGITI